MNETGSSKDYYLWCSLISFFVLDWCVVVFGRFCVDLKDSKVLLWTVCGATVRISKFVWLCHLGWSLRIFGVN